MQRIRSSALAVVVSWCALGGTLCATASATLPEFLPSGSTGFTGTAGKTYFQEPNGNIWLYSSATIKGEITSAKEAKSTTLIFKEGRNGCDTAGELKWEGLKMRLGYISSKPASAGVAFESPKQPFALCNFLGISGKAYGGAVVGRIEPINKKSKTFKVIFQQTKGTQALSNLEGETAFPFVKGNCEDEVVSLEPFELACVGLIGTTKVAIETTFELTTSKEVEIRA